MRPMDLKSMPSSQLKTRTWRPKACPRALTLSVWVLIDNEYFSGSGGSVGVPPVAHAHSLGEGQVAFVGQWRVHQFGGVALVFVGVVEDCPDHQDCREVFGVQLDSDLLLPGPVWGLGERGYRRGLGFGLRLVGRRRRRGGSGRGSGLLALVVGVVGRRRLVL